MLHVLTGALGLLVAGFAARQYSLLIGIAYVAIGAWGLVLGAGGSILGLLPVDAADSLLHLLLGLLGIAAALGTSSPAPAGVPATA